MLEERANKRDEKLGRKVPAWVDKNDRNVRVNIEDVSRLRKLKKTEDEQEVEGAEYQTRLQEQYLKMQGTHSMFDWAQVAPQESESEVEDDPISALLKSNTAVFGKRSEVLQQGQLNFKKVKNANFHSQHQSVLTSMSWHPTEDILLTCGLDRNAKLISDQNVIQQIFLQDLPIMSSVFIRQGKEALFTGNRKHYYMYDLQAQKLQKLTGVLGHTDSTNLENIVASRSKYYCIGSETGYMMVMGQDSKKLLFDLKMNGSCSAMHFSDCERYLFSVGNEAEIYQWDLNTRKCMGRVQDTGAFNTTTMAVSPNNHLLATGSKMGGVNIFHIDPHTHVLEASPFKTLMNLTTAVTDLKFNHSSELLAFCSKWKKNAFKMAHIPSYTVYQNFPGVAPGVLKYPFCLEFSHKSKYLTMGNDEGKAHMFELSHFSE